MLSPTSPSDAGNSCATCGSLPQSYVAQTGYGDHLPAAAHALQRIELADMRRELRRCPTCGDLFDWEDMPQFFGSGNLDEERLDRLRPLPAELAQALLALDFTERTPDDLVFDAAKELPDGLFHAILSYLCYHKPGFEPLVPPLIDLLVISNDQSVVSLLRGWSGKKIERLDPIVDRLERSNLAPKSFAQILLDLSRDARG
jgi:hypothetical protein